MNNKKADTLLKANGWGRTTPWVHYTVEGDTHCWRCRVVSYGWDLWCFNSCDDYLVIQRRSTLWSSRYIYAITEGALIAFAMEYLAETDTDCI